jgi:hypothetical protein
MLGQPTGAELSVSVQRDSRKDTKREALVRKDVKIVKCLAVSLASGLPHRGAGV